MKTALVTGGAQGLGKEIVKALAKKGYFVLVHYKRQEKEANELCRSLEEEGCKAKAIFGDFSSAALISEFIEKLDMDISFLVNNVGSFLTKPLTETTCDEFVEIFQTNVYSVFALITALKQSLIKTKGTVVNTGVCGSPVSRVNNYIPAYSIFKHTLHHMTKTYAKELAPFDVRVNMISPGVLENSVDKDIKSPQTPKGKHIKLDEIVSLLYYLMEDHACNITGQNIEVAGGYCL
ncbi:MAG: putative oxidoreductase YohF [Chlamydiia bacterium]|nr:putative oxidoreductase YohF [Chlamydiia bacterium]